MGFTTLAEMQKYLYKVNTNERLSYLDRETEKSKAPKNTSRPVYTKDSRAPVSTPTRTLYILSVIKTELIPAPSLKYYRCDEIGYISKDCPTNKKSSHVNLINFDDNKDNDLSLSSELDDDTLDTARSNSKNL